MDEYVRLLMGADDSCRDRSTGPMRPDRLPVSSGEINDNACRIAIVPGGAGPLIREQASNISRRVAVVPGGANNLMGEQALRRWPIENYVTLAKRLLHRGWEIMLLGGPEDIWVKQHFQQLAVTDCIGTLSLPEVVIACDACDVVVSHDTGPLHLAGLSKACLVGIFGPTDPSTFLPRRPSVVGIWGGQGFACRPCYDGRDFAPCHFNGCMHQVTPELVLRELDQLFNERSQGISSPWRIVFPDERSSLPNGNDLVALM
jgi:heptosyltransferase-2